MNNSFSAHPLTGHVAVTSWAGASRDSRYHRNRVAIITAGIVLATIFYRFFDRVALFHDEIINTGKASQSLIFDYAMRPLFYAVNSVGVEFFGVHPLSISFVMALGFLLGGWCTYRYSTARWGLLAAVTSTAAYAWLGWIFLFGLGAMPHMVPGVFVLAAWLIYQSKDIEHLDLYRIFGVVLLLWAAVLWHPAAVAMVAAFCLVIGLRLLWCLHTKSLTRGQFIRQVLIWVFGFLSLFLCTEILYQIAADDSFIGSWISLINKTSSAQYAHYFKPYSYYFRLIWERMKVPITVSGVLCFALGISRLLPRIRRRGDVDVYSDSRGVHCMELVAIAIVSLLLVSLERWKFDRVMAGFAPLVTLALVSSAYAAISKLPIRAVLQWAVAIIVIICSFWQFAADISVAKAQIKTKRAVHSGFYEQIRMLHRGRIAYVGEKVFPRVLRYPMEALDRSPIYYVFPGDSDLKSSDIIKMRSKGFRYVVITLSDQTPQSKKLRAYLKQHRMQRVATHRGEHELWELKRVK